MLTRAWFLLSVCWLLFLGITLNWSQLDSDETRNMIIIAVLPLAGGLILKRASRYVVRGE
jgi:hypothetical protein